MDSELSSTPSTSAVRGASSMFRAQVLPLLRSPALGATVLLICGGIGSAAASLLLARVMERAEFGALTLVLALTQLTLSLGPLGLETLINRHRLDADPLLLARAVATSSAVAAALAAAAVHFYGVGVALSVPLAVAAAGASLSRIGGAFLQSRGRLKASLMLLQVHNYVLLGAVPLLLLLGRDDALPVAVLVAAAYVATSIFGWAAATRLPRRSSVGLSARALLKEGLAAAGVGLAAQVLWQLERLVIPRTLSVEDLATFAVLASVAGAPFRMLQTGIVYTLLPGLRACKEKTAVKRLLYREGAAVFAAASAAALLVLLLTPWIMTHVLTSRYYFPRSLLGAVVGVGLVKVWNGFVAAIVPALGTARHLALFNTASWFAVCLGVAGAFAGSRFGLTGVVCGVGASWLALAAVGTALSLKAVRGFRPLL
ncbi:MAG TPA: oligosaccharide flippase family protein [Gammaproteobacteria bacterium]|nr:oligosaccharide flippase family protein [Gammaproteobacteria bacterium]